MAVIVEVCSYSVEDCIRAQAAGAGRVELCADVFAGGTTPSIGLQQQVKAVTDLDVAVMIRPRGGDFVYSDDELQIMARDITAAARAGADAVVFGLLTKEGRVDMDRAAPLVEQAKEHGLTTVFHRAFDVTPDAMEALEAIIHLGMDRLLTSGQRKRAAEGLEPLEALIGAAGSELEIMPGGGVRSDNVDSILALNVRSIHTGRSRQIPSPMQWHNDEVSMGLPAFNDRERRLVDDEEIRRIVSRANRY